MSRLRPRHGIAVLVLLVVGGVVAAAVGVLRTEQASELRTQEVVVEAPRGRILDRRGRVLVEDGTVTRVAVDPSALARLPAAERRAVVRRLAEALGAERAPADVRGLVPGAPAGSGLPLPAVDVAARLDQVDGDDGVVLLDRSAPADVVARLRRDQLPGVLLTDVAARRYPYGALAAHVLGYVGTPTADEAARLPDGASVVGKAGVERADDADLRGTAGRIVYEVDAAGVPIRELTDRRIEPEPGRDVTLTIDIDLQYLVERALAAESKRRTGVVDNGCTAVDAAGTAVGCTPQGAAGVVVDPTDGAVLAMASYPTYDPDLFAGGISTAEYDALSDPDRTPAHLSPLLNRAFAGQYAPASTIKPFTAVAALQAGLITPQTPYDDTGKYAFSADCDLTVPARASNCYVQNAGAAAHGRVDLARALTVSSDTYWSWLGDRSWRGREALGEEAIQDGLAEWGFGARTGVDLVGESRGRVPTPEWLMDFSRSLNEGTGMSEDDIVDAGTWTSGTSANLLAGQGDLLVTPLQLASAYAALARGGAGVVPHLTLDGPADDVEAPSVDLEPGWAEAVWSGLDGVVNDAGGTATQAFAGVDQTTCSVAGKTGTARVDGKNDTSWFAALSPSPASGRPARLAMAVVVQEAGFGASAAVPVTRRVLEPAGCDPDAGLPAEFAAPLGGWFDVDQTIAEFVPPVPETPD